MMLFFKNLDISSEINFKYLHEDDLTCREFQEKNSSESVENFCRSLDAFNKGRNGRVRSKLIIH